MTKTYKAYNVPPDQSYTFQATHAYTPIHTSAHTLTHTQHKLTHLQLNLQIKIHNRRQKWTTIDKQVRKVCQISNKIGSIGIHG